MTEDVAIRIDFDSIEFVHVTHTMEFFLRPTPRNLSHRILGTRPRRSELEFSNKTRLPRYLPTDSLTSCLGYPYGWVASVNTINHYDWVASVNTINHPPPCGNLSHWDSRVYTMDLEIITPYRARVACVHNLPYLVISAEGTTLAESRPAHTSKCGCTDRLGSVAPGQRLLCSSSFSMIFCNMC